MSKKTFEPKSAIKGIFYIFLWIYSMAGFGIVVIRNLQQFNPQDMFTFLLPLGFTACVSFSKLYEHMIRSREMMTGKSD